MTHEEELAWARAEHVARLADLKDRTLAGLERAQKNAEARRRAVGLSPSQVALLVRAVGSERRAEEMRAHGVAEASEPKVDVMRAGLDNATFHAQGRTSGAGVDATPSAQQLLDGAQFVQHQGGGQYRTCAEWDAAGVFVPLAKWQALAKHLDGVPEAQPHPLQVWFGPMPESNGRTNWTAILHRGDLASGHTVERSEHHDRVRFEADRVRWLIGELPDEPDLLAYDGDMLNPEGYQHPCGVDGPLKEQPR